MSGRTPGCTYMYPGGKEGYTDKNCILPRGHKGPHHIIATSGASCYFLTAHEALMKGVGSCPCTPGRDCSCCFYAHKPKPRVWVLDGSGTDFGDCAEWWDEET